MFALLCSRANALPWLHVDGNHLADPSGHSVTLRGVDMPYLDYAANSQGGIQHVIDNLTNGTGNNQLYSKVIRLVVPPGGWRDNPDNYFKSYLDPAVQYCIQKNVYCIIDFHGYYKDAPPGGSEDDYTSPAIDQDIRAFWGYVAPKYKNNPNILYELYNEPVNPQDWNTWKKTAQPWVDLIRSAAPQNIIIIGSPLYSEFSSSAVSSPFNGTNLVYTQHVYAGNGNDNSNAWEHNFGNASNSIPIFITEFGWDGSTNPSDCCNGTTSGFGQSFRNYLDNVHPNVNWSVWDYGFSPAMIDSNLNLLGGNNEGQFIQQWLSDKKNSDQPTDDGSGGSSSSSGGSGSNSTQSLYIADGNSTGFTGNDGSKWVADEYFDGGNIANRGNITVQGDPTGYLYQNEHYGMHGYHIPLPNGTYKVTLDFAETYNGITGPGQRVFDADIEGTTIAGIDPWAQAGGFQIASHKSAVVTVTNGKLDIIFTPHVQNPEINGIEIVPQ